MREMQVHVDHRVGQLRHEADIRQLARASRETAREARGSGRPWQAVVGAMLDTLRQMTREPARNTR